MRARVISNNDMLSKFVPANLKLSTQDYSVLQSILFSTPSSTRQLLSDLSSQPVNIWDARATNLIQFLQTLLVSSMTAASVYELSAALKRFVNSRDYDASFRYVRYGWSDLGVVTYSSEFNRFNASLDTFIESINPKATRSYFNSLSAVYHTSQSTFASVMSKLNPTLALLFFAGMPTVAARNAQTEGLALDLQFNRNAFDSSGNGNHAIVNGAYLVDDMYGNKYSAYRFQHGSFMKGPVINFPTATRTLSMWINLRKGGSVFGYGGGPMAGGGANFNFLLDYECQGNDIAFMFGAGGSEGPYFAEYTKTVTVPTGWAHYVMTTEPSVSKFYINAKLVDSQNLFFNATNLIDRGEFGIGTIAAPDGQIPFQNNCTAELDADIDKVQLFSYAFNPEQVSAKFNEKPATPPKKPKPDKYNATSLAEYFGAGFGGSLLLFGFWAYRQYKKDGQRLQENQRQIDTFRR